MCVKIFEGYSCGHCSIPVVQPCPQTWSSIHFPYCKFPAIRPIQVGHMCHGCNRIAWNHFWDQANAYTTVHGQVIREDSYIKNGLLKDERQRNHIKELTSLKENASAQMIGTGSQVQRSKEQDIENRLQVEPQGNCYEIPGYPTFQYLGYQVDGRPFEAANRDRQNHINVATEGCPDTKWYSGPGQYQGASFDNRIVSTNAVSAEKATQTLCSYPTLQTPYQQEQDNTLRSTSWQIDPTKTRNRGAYTPLTEKQHPASQYAPRNRGWGNEKILDARVPVFYPHEAIMGMPNNDMAVKVPTTYSSKPWPRATMIPKGEPTFDDPSDGVCKIANAYGTYVRYATDKAQINATPMVVSSEMSDYIR